MGEIKHNISDASEIYSSVIKDLISNISKKESESSWYEEITKNLKNPHLKDLDDLRKRLNDHSKCEKVKDGRIPALYCRLILEYICQRLLLISFDNGKIKFSGVKKRYSQDNKIQKCKKYTDLFIYLKLNDIISLLEEKIIKRKENDTLNMYDLMISLRDQTNEALHLRLDSKRKVIKKEYPVKLIIETTNRLIEEFLDKFEKFL